MLIIITFAAVVTFAADAAQVRKVGYWCVSAGTSLSRSGNIIEVSREVYSRVCIPCDHIALSSNGVIIFESLASRQNNRTQNRSEYDKPIRAGYETKLCASRGHP